MSRLTRGVFRALLRRGGGGRVANILFRDEFTTDQSAGNVNGSLAEPGNGSATRAATDTGSNLTIASAKLHFSNTSAGAGNPGFWEKSFARQIGLAFVYKVDLSATGVGIRIGADGNQASAAPNAVEFVGASTEVRATHNNGVSATQVGVYTAATHYVALVARNPGFALCLKGGNFTDWTQLWVSAVAASEVYDPIFPAISRISATTFQVVDVDYFRAATLPAWAGQYASAVGSKPTNSADDTINMSADGLVEWTFTAETGVTKELSIRRTDDDNRYILRCDQTNSTIRLYKVEGGSESEVTGGTTTQTWTNGSSFRVNVQCVGTGIKAWVNGTLKNVTTGNTFNQSAMGAKASHAGTEFNSWYYTLPAALKAGLDAVLNAA